MANTARTQTALADSDDFRARLKAALTVVAWQVLNEANTVPNHAARWAYARQVADSPGSFADRLAGSMSERPNVLGATTSYDFDVRAVITAATDAAIESQLATDWDRLAGVVS